MLIRRRASPHLFLSAAPAPRGYPLHSRTSLFKFSKPHSRAHRTHTHTNTHGRRMHAREREDARTTDQPTNQPTNRLTSQPASQRGCPHTDRTHAQTRQRVSHGAKRQPTLGSRERQLLGWMDPVAGPGPLASRCTFTREPNRTEPAERPARTELTEYWERPGPGPERPRPASRWRGPTVPRRNREPRAWGRTRNSEASSAECYLSRSISYLRSRQN